jgi:hypothetical protein
MNVAGDTHAAVGGRHNRGRVATLLADSRPGGRGGLLGGQGGANRDVQCQAWQWALANRAGDGSLPSGREIARQYSRHERWGRLVKRAGAAGEFAPGLGLHLIDQGL